MPTYKAKSRIKHNGNVYEAGDEIADLSASQVKRLTEIGVIEPADNPQPTPDAPADAPENNDSVDEQNDQGNDEQDSSQDQTADNQTTPKPPENGADEQKPADDGADQQKPGILDRAKNALTGNKKDDNPQDSAGEPDALPQASTPQASNPQPTPEEVAKTAQNVQ